MSSETVDDGTTVVLDPNDSRVITFNWDRRNLPDSALISSSVFDLIAVQPAALAISSITRSGTTATVTTAAAHGRSTGDTVTIAGCAQSDYNVTATITVTTTTAFTYTVANSPTTPATAATGGAMTYSQGLGKDNPSIGAAAIVIDGITLLANRYTQIRLLAYGPSHVGKRFEIANKIVTNESPTQTKERSFYVVIDNI